MCLGGPVFCYASGDKHIQKSIILCSIDFDNDFGLHLQHFGILEKLNRADTRKLAKHVRKDIKAAPRKNKILSGIA